MKLIEKLFGGNRTKYTTIQSNNFEVVERQGASFNFNDDVATSDIVKACIRPTIKAIGKLEARHILDQQVQDSNLINLLHEPNEIDSLQTLLEKLVTQLKLNNNAYAIVKRDKQNEPIAIVPVLSNDVEMVESKSGNYFIKFRKNGEETTVPYADVIHLRQEHNTKEYFGTNPSYSISDVLKAISVSDEAVEAAVTNSTRLQWLMKFNTTLTPEDQLKAVEQFKSDYLNMQNNGGVGASDNKYELEKIKQDVLIPDTAIQKEKIERIYNYFGVNESIVKSDYDEDQWSAFYESEIEPLIVALSNEFTRKLFTKVERLSGNKIIFTSTGLQFASMESKLKLVEMVDRGLMTPNEVRIILNLPKVDDGDVPIRRLDTARVDDERFGNIDDNLKGGDEVE